MEWKIPEIFQQTWDRINPQSQREENAMAKVANDVSDDNPRVSGVSHKGTIPFRRVESAVHTFVQVAVPADLDRLHRHRNNIKKWRKIKDLKKLEAEYINSGRTVKQLTRNLHEMELLRTKVIEEDLPEFDKRLNPAKERSMESICEFLEIHGEALDKDGKIGEPQKSKTTNEQDLRTEQSQIDGTQVSQNPSSENEQPIICGDFGNGDLQIPTQTEVAKVSDSTIGATSGGVVSLRGNQIVIEPVIDSETRNEEISHPLTQSLADEASTDVSEVIENCQNEDKATFTTQVQTQEEVLPEDGAEEWWEKLRKDLVDLHSTMEDFSAMVHSQGEVVDDIAGNVEDAEKNISEGKSQLNKATVVKAAMFPVLGAVVGGIVGGPIGFAAGMKLGSITSGLAAAGVTGTMIGYQGGKLLKEKQEKRETIEMMPMSKEEKSNNENSE